MNTETDLARRVLGPTAESLRESCQSRELVPGQDTPHYPELASCLADVTLAGLDGLIEKRRSMTSFTGQPVPVPDVVEICRTAVDASRCYVSAGADGYRARWIVLAATVSGLAPALYEYADAQLTRVAALPDERVMAYAGQPGLVTAPCVVYPLWDLGLALSQDGTDGYFNILMTASSSLYCGWLAALSRDLSGCLFKGVNPVALYRGVGAGRPGRYPVLALAVGYGA
jgi:hypothetical protein